ncbi:MAG: hypothetical protein D6767_07230 [Candidatus Hydrogenedentota bacterium]|nr:MAG: hypothetical protein D6767_07230 [Candidatus Hydrogenedentota bacterium]
MSLCNKDEGGRDLSTSKPFFPIFSLTFFVEKGEGQQYGVSPYLWLGGFSANPHEILYVMWNNLK